MTIKTVDWGTRASTPRASDPGITETTDPRGIVQFLRQRSEGGDILEAAADEIERLRAALEHLRDSPCDPVWVVERCDEALGDEHA